MYEGRVRECTGMEGRKPPLNLEGLSRMMKEEEGFSPDLEIVRPDQNQGCSSSSSSPPPSPPSYIEKVPISALSIFQLEDHIKSFRKHCSVLTLKDGNAKLQHHLFLLENELAHRRSQTQTGIDVEAVENMHPLPNPKLIKRKQEVLVGAIENTHPLLNPKLIKRKQEVFDVECDKEGIPSSAQTKETVVDDIQDPGKSPCSGIAKVCFKCRQSVSNGTPQSKENGRFCCSSCKKNLTSSPANGATSVNIMRENVCGISRVEKSPGSTKRSQQAVGDTFDTALELSDDEELREVVIGESSNNLSMRKRLRSASKKLAGAKFLYPSSCDPDAVEVRGADLRHLAPSEFLNDTVIDFYIKYMQMNFFEEKDRLHRFHFFSCFFYKKLTSAKKARGKDWFEEVHKWTKGINIFKKSYLFIPIHDSCHWSLAIICFLVGQKVPYILHLDSMSSAGHPSIGIFNVLKSYLMAERKHLIQENDIVDDITTIEPSRATCKRTQVPLQDNEWDCGLFMLYYIQKFVEEVDSKDLDDMFGRNWFKPNEASELRGTIFTILESIFSQEAT